MDSTSEELVTTLGIDLAILSVMLLFFVPLKNIRSHPDTIGRVPPYCERTATVSTLVGKVYKANDAEILRSCQAEGYNYMINLRYFAILVGVMCVIGLTVLFPIYSQGDTDVDTDLSEIAVQHILDNDRFLWSVVACWVIFSLLVYFAAGYFLYKVHSMESHNLSSTQEQSVQISKLPLEKTTDELQRRLVDYFSRIQPGCVLSVYVVPDITEVLLLQNQVMKARDNLASAEAYFSL